jgi:predicted anti-sigma-YlaC factor YlaD
MKCEDFKIKMLDELMGEISVEESLLLEEHLRECERCREEIEKLERVLNLLKSSKDWNPPPYLKEKIKRKLELKRKGNPIWNFLNTPVRLYHAILIIIISLFLYAFIGKVFTKRVSPPTTIAKGEKEYIPERRDTLFKFYTAPSRLPYRL